MSKVLILGAHGQIARVATQLFLAETDAKLRLYLRAAHRLPNPDPRRVHIVEGDVNDEAKLRAVLAGQDVVYANLAGEDLAQQVSHLVAAMKATGVQRLIFISAIGIYNEVTGNFGEWNKQTLGNILERYRQASDIIEASDLNYTILRPTWLTNYDEVDYEIVGRNESVKGTEVSRKSVAALVVKLATTAGGEERQNLGVSKPGTAGEKHAWL
ncbi:SDR family oxidoreductase [Hymenobacter metallicola]|uniref:SDR family oxidoreductase n=1 Tax=Hymenobacter metallicola TaxID=2563114 RepID=A0A4Z0Q0M7_9BACT|nr:SDR family oxidoreductase [Hymenobacter metallicola]TGE22713.1 SDR family oxidoreductase [Hymenobacter metallicola]